MSAIFLLPGWSFSKFHLLRNKTLESNRSKLFKNIINVYPKNYTKYVNELCGKRGYSKSYT